MKLLESKLKNMGQKFCFTLEKNVALRTVLRCREWGDLWSREKQPKCQTTE